MFLHFNSSEIHVDHQIMIHWILESGLIDPSLDSRIDIGDGKM